MVTSYAERRPAIHLTVTGNIAAGISGFLNLIGDQAMAATIRHLQNEVTDKSFAASDGETTNSLPTYQILLLSQPILT